MNRVRFQSGCKSRKQLYTLQILNDIFSIIFLKHLNSIIYYAKVQTINERNKFVIFFHFPSQKRNPIILYRIDMFNIIRKIRRFIRKTITFIQNNTLIFDL